LNEILNEDETIPKLIFCVNYQLPQISSTQPDCCVITDPAAQQGRVTLRTVAFLDKVGAFNQ